MNTFLVNPFNPLTLLAIGFGAVLLLLTWLIFDIHKKWNRMFGKRARNDTDALAEVLGRLAAAEKNIGNLAGRTAALENIGEAAIQKIGFKRFNPFERTGGDQSFAVALLDRGNSGVIVSSLYTRDGVRVYAKEIKAGDSRHPLSEEEREVIEQAINGESMKHEA